MKKIDRTAPAPAPRSAHGLVATALAVTGIIAGCTESYVAMPDAAGPADAAVQRADAATTDSGGVVDAAIANADASSVDAAIANADALSVDATAWEDDAGADANPYLRG